MNVEPHLARALILARGAVALVLLGPHGAQPSAAVSGTEVRFVSPRHLSTAFGPTPILLEVSSPPGVAIVQVVILVDGKPLKRLASPPWSTSWDAGEAEAGHWLEATVTLADWSEVHDSIRTTPLVVQQYEEVNLVNVYAIVKDAEGNYVNDLQAEDFRLAEDGNTHLMMDRFSAERRPLRIGIVLDTSLSMQEGDKLAEAIDAATGFLKVLEPGDQGMAVSFNDSVDVIQPLTGDKKAIAEAIGKARAVGGTALYDAIWRGADQLVKFEGRRVIVLLSDGHDVAASGLEPGSLHTLDEALDRALRDEVMIFAIGVGSHLAQQTDFYGRQSLAAILGKLADATGGRLLLSSRSSKLRRAFEEVAEDLRHQYSLAYVPKNLVHDGSWHEIRLTLAKPGLTATGRRGYFAPRANETRP